MLAGAATVLRRGTSRGVASLMRNEDAVTLALWLRSIPNAQEFSAARLHTCAAAVSYRASSEPKPGNEAARCTLILSIGLSAALKRVFLGERNAGYVEQEVEHRQRTNDRDPAMR
jgi:hypothetical protein